MLNSLLVVFSFYHLEPLEDKLQLILVYLKKTFHYNIYSVSERMEESGWIYLFEFFHDQR